MAPSAETWAAPPAGRRELREREAAVARGETVKESGRIRRRGAGRPRLTESQPGLLEALRKLVDPYERGDPERPLRWVAKSLRQLAKALREMNYTISHTKVGELLVELGFSLQSNRKTKEGRNHPERNAQFDIVRPSERSAWNYTIYPSDVTPPPTPETID